MRRCVEVRRIRTLNLAAVTSCGCSLKPFRGPKDCKFWTWAGLTEGNINFLGGLGGTIHAVDLLGSFDQMQRELADRPLDSHAAHGFVNDFLNFPRKQFDAILAWDTLEFLGHGRVAPDDPEDPGDLASRRGAVDVLPYRGSRERRSRFIAMRSSKSTGFESSRKGRGNCPTPSTTGAWRGYSKTSGR